MRWLFLLAVAGCIHTIEEHESRVGDITRDCVIPTPSGITALAAPVSIESPDASIWIWESLPAADGSTIVNATATITRTTDLCAQAPSLEREVPTGLPRSILVLTADERVPRTDGRTAALRPTGGFFANGLGYLYYTHVLRGPGLFDEESLGTGLCVITPGSSEPCERVTATGSTVLWRPDEHVLNRGGLVVGSRAVIAGCRKVGSFDEPCTVAGVMLGAVRDPSRYEVYDAFHGWVDTMTDASEITNTIGSLTIAPFVHRQYIATQLEILANKVVVQVSNNVEQNYGRRVHVFDVLPPRNQWFVTGGREHAALRTDPNSIVVTYQTDNPDAPGLHLVELRFFGEVE